MEGTGYLIILAIAVAAVAMLASNKKGVGRKSSARFQARIPLSEPEQILFHCLTTALPNHIVLSQVAFSQFIYAKGGDKKQNYSRKAEAKQKVADFLVCKPSFEMVSVIELDDKSHKKQKDEKKDAILKEAGLKIIRWNVSRMPNKEQIQKTVLNTTA